MTPAEDYLVDKFLAGFINADQMVQRLHTLRPQETSGAAPVPTDSAQAGGVKEWLSAQVKAGLTKAGNLRLDDALGGSVVLDCDEFAALVRFARVHGFEIPEEGR